MQAHNAINFGVIRARNEAPKTEETLKSAIIKYIYLELEN
jgi:hypothetical protein